MNLTYKDILRDHQDRNKEVLGLTFCKLCGKNFPHPEALIMHHRESHGKGLFKL